MAAGVDLESGTAVVGPAVREGRTGDVHGAVDDDPKRRIKVAFRSHHGGAAADIEGPSGLHREVTGAGVDDIFLGLLAGAPQRRQGDALAAGDAAGLEDNVLE